MTANARDENVETIEANKRAWVAPRIEHAPAHEADAFGGAPNGADYGIYS